MVDVDTAALGAEQDTALPPFYRYLHILKAVSDEADRGRRVHGGRDFASLHEALAVLWEEAEELKEAVFKDHPRLCVRREALQVAAMAVRLLHEFPDSAEGWPLPYAGAAREKEEDK